MVLKNLLDFIENSPCSYFTAANIKKMLIENGFNELSEGEKWNIKENRKYFVTRNNSSIIAFKIPTLNFKGFQIIAGHGDSPCFKIKENPEIKSSCVILNTEGYGGMILNSWLDRPLSIAGRIIVRLGNSIKSKLVNIDRDLVLIPNLAVHFNSKINDGYVYKPNIDMKPIFSENSKRSLKSLLAEKAEVSEKDIYAYDMFLYNREKGRIWGYDNEYISAPRLDDLQCVFSCFDGFLKGEKSENISVFSVFDNEEVGSVTKQGAASSFLKDVLIRINEAANGDDSDFINRLSGSFMISADNAHAVHPNFPNISDFTNRPLLNKGVVIKYSANQKYTTDAVSDGIMRVILDNASVPYQTYSTRSDINGGSTLGNISSQRVSINCVDIGLAQLAMHSAYETAGAFDSQYLMNTAKQFYDSTILFVKDGDYKIY